MPAFKSFYLLDVRTMRKVLALASGHSTFGRLQGKKAERHSDSNSFSFSIDFPEGNVLFIRKFLHTPRGLKACSEVHRNEQPDLEPFDELSATKGIAVADTSVYGEHHHIETVGNLTDVLQLAKELLLMGYRVKHLLHLKAVSLLIRIVV